MSAKRKRFTMLAVVLLAGCGDGWVGESHQRQDRRVCRQMLSLARTSSDTVLMLDATPHEDGWACYHARAGDPR